MLIWLAGALGLAAIAASAGSKKKSTITTEEALAIEPVGIGIFDVPLEPDAVPLDEGSPQTEPLILPVLSRIAKQSAQFGLTAKMGEDRKPPPRNVPEGFGGVSLDPCAKPPVMSFDRAYNETMGIQGSKFDVTDAIYRLMFPEGEFPIKKLDSICGQTYLALLVEYETRKAQQENRPPPEIEDPDEIDPTLMPLNRGVPFAPIESRSMYPLVSTKKNEAFRVHYRIAGPPQAWRGRSGNAFKSERAGKDGGKKFHAAMDLSANPGDLVIAPVSGRILDITPFYTAKNGNKVWAVYLRGDNDTVFNLGEVEKDSWKEFGIERGKRVSMGDPIARTGDMSSKSRPNYSMVHFETFDAKGLSDPDMKSLIRRGKFQWKVGTAPHERLRDPSLFLLMASRRSAKEEGIV